MISKVHGAIKHNDREDETYMDNSEATQWYGCAENGKKPREVGQSGYKCTRPNPDHVPNNMRMIQVAIIEGLASEVKGMHTENKADIGWTPNKTPFTQDYIKVTVKRRNCESDGERREILDVLRRGTKNLEDFRRHMVKGLVE